MHSPTWDVDLSCHVSERRSRVRINHFRVAVIPDLSYLFYSILDEDTRDSMLDVLRYFWCWLGKIMEASVEWGSRRGEVM